jgi:inosose dehydratase
MSVMIGVNPIGWNNDDLQSLGDEYTRDDYLSEGAAIGFAGFEMGHKLPSVAWEMRPLLDKYGLKFVSGWYSTELLKRSVKDEIAAVQKHMALLKGMGCSVMVTCEVSGCIHGQLETPLSQRPVLPADQWAEFGRKMTEFGKYMADAELPVAYHHHMGTVVQTEAEVDRFMEVTGPEVGLLLDTGHLTFGGGDAVAVAKRWGRRINHVHCKDIRPALLKRSLAEDWSFLKGVVEGVFTVPGDGCVDYRAVLSAVKAAGYRGKWLVIEAEQDPAKANPKQYLTKGFNHLKSLAAELGL